MTALLAAVGVLVVFGSVLAMAEASMTRISSHRARALAHEGRRNAGLLDRIQSDPPPHLNSVYLAVMLTQNGSAILVAIVADRTYGDLGITITSVVFTLVYFVLVEAMSKTFAILHSDRVALFLAPVVVGLRRIFSVPVRLLIGLANVLLPGRGLRQGPFVSVEEIRQLAEAGAETGSLQAQETQLIASVLDVADTTAAQVMVPRPDMAVVRADQSLDAAMDLMIRSGHSRLPVYEGEADNIVGVVYVKDVLQAARNGDASVSLKQIAREGYFLPETIRVLDALREMQRRRVQIALVTDEHGDVAGLLTIEDILEEIVGEITDEDDVQIPRVVTLGRDLWRIHARMNVRDFNDAVGAALPEDQEWQTIGGLISTTLAKIPEPGDTVAAYGYRFRVEDVSGPRIGVVLVERQP